MRVIIWLTISDLHFPHLEKSGCYHFWKLGIVERAVGWVSPVCFCLSIENFGSSYRAVGESVSKCNNHIGLRPPTGAKKQVQLAELDHFWP